MSSPDDVADALELLACRRSACPVRCATYLKNKVKSDIKMATFRVDTGLNHCSTISRFTSQEEIDKFQLLSGPTINHQVTASLEDQANEISKVLSIIKANKAMNN